MDLALAHVDSQFPPGTGVDAYLAADFPNGWATAAGLPAGIVSRGNAAVGANGSLTIAGLVAGTRYRLAATVGGVLRSVSHYLAPPIDAVPDFGAFADGQFAQWNAAMSEFVGAAVDLSAYETSAHAAATFAPLASPALTGNPTATTQVAGNNTARLATTAFVTAAVAAVDLSSYAPLASPALTGNPTAPTQAAGNSSTRLATTAFVATSFALLASPTFTGTPAGPTAAVDTNTTQLATTAYVVGQAYAKLASPTFTGTPVLPTGTTGVTQAAGDSSTKLATTAFVTTADNLKATLASPTFTGTPAAPTAAGGTNTTQLATTAFVATSFAPLASPALTGSPTVTGNLEIDGSAPGTKQLVVKGAASQSVSVFEVQNSAGTVAAKHNAAGDLSLTRSLGIGGPAEDPPGIAGAIHALRYVAANQGTSGNQALFGCSRGSSNAAPGVAFGTNLDAAITRVAVAVLDADKFRWLAANEQTTVGAAGAASALPVFPTKYLKVQGSDGTELVVPAYAA